ncbi:MAG: hypothetical protein A2Y17_12525 [Clostridiales bacterium GWF2_38_85]|nr:MAG: hypothetical protein A2Y17_12525 [Clostridiales bacterium GWF2_38_85]HBL84083.1 hypothetical protein [Clostridiales bacterium]
MKKSKKIALVSILTVVATMFLTAASPDPKVMLSNGISPISGTFIQPWLYGSWSDARWDSEMQIWQQMGIEYLIVGDTAMVDASNNYSIKADYPTNIEGATKGTDNLTKLYQKCKQYDIKLYIGMGNTVGGWDYLDFTNAASVDKFQKVATAFATIAEDIYNIYYEDYKEIFAGFYFVPELYNSNHFDSQANRTKYVNGFSTGLNIVLDKINSLNPDLPFIFSPYVNIFGGSWVTKDPNSIEAFWKELFATAHFRDGDVFCPQDSVGAGGMGLANLDAWTHAYKNAVESCGKSVKLWSNCEIFEQPKDKYYESYDGYNYWCSADVGRMSQQLEIVSKYVERIFVFAFPHYLSPYTVAPGYYNSYLDYLENGVLESIAPTPMDKFRTLKTVVNGKEGLSIYWSGMYDNFGIHRVNIYKNGEFLTYRNAAISESTSKTAPYPNNFTDYEFDFDAESTIYEFEVIDCAGNISEKVSFTVEKGSVPNNVKLDSVYKGPVEESEEESEVSNNESTEVSVQDNIPDNNNPFATIGIAAIAVAGVAAIGFGIVKFIGMLSCKKKK